MHILYGFIEDLLSKEILLLKILMHNVNTLCIP